MAVCPGCQGHEVGLCLLLLRLFLVVLGGWRSLGCQGSCLLAAPAAATARAAPGQRLQTAACSCCSCSCCCCCQSRGVQRRLQGAPLGAKPLRLLACLHCRLGSTAAYRATRCWAGGAGIPHRPARKQGFCISCCGGCAAGDLAAMLFLTSEPDASSWESDVAARHSTASWWPLKNATRCAVAGILICCCRCCQGSFGWQSRRLVRQELEDDHPSRDHLTSASCQPNPRAHTV